MLLKYSLFIFARSFSPVLMILVAKTLRCGGASMVCSSSLKPDSNVFIRVSGIEVSTGFLAELAW